MLHLADMVWKKYKYFLKIDILNLYFLIYLIFFIFTNIYNNGICIIKKISIFINKENLHKKLKFLISPQSYGNYCRQLDDFKIQLFYLKKII